MLAPERQGTPANETEPAGRTVLEVEDLSLEFVAGDASTTRALDGVGFAVRAGEAMGIVGESGCGKSTVALSIMRLHDPRRARVTSGRILFEGRDLLALPQPEMKRLRGDRLAMIFQDPMTALNPVLTIGRQLGEVVGRDASSSRAQVRSRCVDLLAMVGIPEPARRLGQYPFEFSGGMRQRVLIAMALAREPALIVADEPTTALDVTVQAQVLDTLMALQQRSKSSLVLITHNLGIVAETCQRVIVMYAGQVVEEATVDGLFAAPRHPYTQGLLRALPRLGSREPLREIPGSIPSLRDRPPGCAFAPRCERADARCRAQTPALAVTDLPTHRVACWKAA